jgi:uridylate kinase
MGMLATVINGMALGNVLEQHGRQVRVMSSLDIPRVAETFIRKRALKHLEKGRIVICVAGTGNPYFTTDSAAVLRALELNCDQMIKGTKVDGIYDKDPNIHTDAVRFEDVSFEQALELNLRIMDQSAIALAKDEQLPVFVCHIDAIDQIGQPGLQ